MFLHLPTTSSTTTPFLGKPNYVLTTITLDDFVVVAVFMIVRTGLEMQTK